MPDVSFSTLHPYLRLGLLVVVAAVLLDAGYLGTRWTMIVDRGLSLRPPQPGLLYIAGSLAVLFETIKRLELHGGAQAGA